jgi:hypothetical protein
VAALSVGGVLALFSARRRRRTVPGRSRWLPLASLALFFSGAMFFHALAGAAAGRSVGRSPLAGAEGWYFDVLRPIEACAAAALLYAAIPARRTRLAIGVIVILLLAADAAGTFGLLLPRWAGLPSAGWSPAALREAMAGAREAAPLLYPPLLAEVLAAIFLAASVRLVALFRPAAAARGAIAE